jgi:hypothetical protein
MASNSQSDRESNGGHNRTRMIHGARAAQDYCITSCRLSSSATFG